MGERGRELPIRKGDWKRLEDGLENVRREVLEDELEWVKWKDLRMCKKGDWKRLENVNFAKLYWFSFPLISSIKIVS